MKLQELDSLDAPAPVATTNGASAGTLPNGEAVAAIFAAGIGCLALGLLTTLAEASAGFKTMLAFNAGVGPLSGKTTYAVVIWLIAWAALHFMWRQKQMDFARMFTSSLVLIGLGLLGTFPIFYQLFAAK